GFMTAFLAVDVHAREAPDIVTTFDVSFVAEHDAFGIRDLAVNVKDVFLRSGAAAKHQAIPFFLSAPIGQLWLDTRLKRRLEAEVVIGGQDIRDRKTHELPVNVVGLQLPHFFRDDFLEAKIDLPAYEAGMFLPGPPAKRIEQLFKVKR